jgi:hypothetical protein
LVTFVSALIAAGPFQCAQQCDSSISKVRPIRIEQTSLPKRGPAMRASAGMIPIPRGDFWMGTDFHQMNDAKPVHRVHVDAFWMDATDACARTPWGIREWLRSIRKDRPIASTWTNRAFRSACKKAGLSCAPINIAPDTCPAAEVKANQEPQRIMRASAA